MACRPPPALALLPPRCSPLPRCRQAPEEPRINALCLPVLPPGHQHHFSAHPSRPAVPCSPPMSPPAPTLRQLISTAHRRQIQPPGHTPSHFCAFAQNVSSPFNCQTHNLQVLCPGPWPREPRGFCRLSGASPSVLRVRPSHLWPQPPHSHVRL